MIHKYIIITLATIITFIPVTKDVGGHEASVNQVVSAHTLAEPISADLKPIEPAKPKSTPKPKNVAQAKPTAPKKTVRSSGTCEDWIAQAGIKDKSSARELISRESGCNPRAVNPSSGACNVAQELPCGKSGCKFGDGACSVKWMHSYVKARYGSWANAVSHHDRMNWY